MNTIQVYFETEIKFNAFTVGAKNRIY